MLMEASAVHAQQLNLPLNREFTLATQRIIEQHTNRHTTFKPLIQSFVQAPDSIKTPTEDDFYFPFSSRAEIKQRSWLMRKMHYENFIIVDTGKLYFTIDPLLHLELGEDMEDESPTKEQLYVNTRGIIVKGSIGEKFSFESVLYENQARFSEHMDSIVQNSLVVPGQGRIKTFKTGAYDYSSSSAYISYSPTGNINFQLGTGKHFIGEGYRSLLLSDVAFNYPYLKATVLFGKEKFQYNKLHAQLNTLTRRASGSTPEALFERKNLSVHYLNWMPNKWFSVGLFESTVWQTEDSTGTKPFVFGQLNPIPLLNTLTTGFEDENNSMLGINGKVKTSFKTIFYGQLVWDGGNKTGFQTGVKFNGAKNLFLMAEYNTVNPETYTSDIELQHYDHYNQPLAHPLGNNFTEWVAIANYRYKRWFTQLKVNQASYDNSSSSNTSTTETQLNTLQAHMGYTVNPKNNMQLIAGITNRTRETAGILTKTNYLYFSFRTALRNLYNDF